MIDGQDTETQPQIYMCMDNKSCDGCTQVGPSTTECRVAVNGRCLTTTQIALFGALALIFLLLIVLLASK